MLAATVPFQRFQSVSWRHSQVVQSSRAMQILKLAPGYILDVRRKSARAFAPKNLFRLRTREADDH